MSQKTVYMDTFGRSEKEILNLPTEDIDKEIKRIFELDSVHKKEENLNEIASSKYPLTPSEAFKVEEIDVKAEDMTEVEWKDKYIAGVDPIDENAEVQIHKKENIK